MHQARFDAYTASTRAAKPHDALSLCLRLGDRLREGRGHHGFSDRIAVIGDDGAEAASVSSGGLHADLVMIEVKGSRTPEVVEAIRGKYEHRCTRVDSCYDVDEPGAFEKLLQPCMEVKKQFRIRGGKAGDWEDFPEDGRTLYLGSAKSAVRTRLYEKGRQPEYLHLNRPDWARLEIQVRPAKDAKEAYAKASPVEVWGASGWTRELAGRFLEAQIGAMPAGTTYRLTDQERRLRFMCKQYGATIVQLAQDLGSWELVGANLREMIMRENANMREAIIKAEQ